MSEADVEALILDIIPERNREALRSQAGTEWICDVPDVGRIRCVTFRDHRGAGGIFRMIPARAISAEQLGLSREIQGLCAEAEGLVLVAGPRSSGKSTLISAFVDLINRTRSEHVITIENQIKFVHENRGSLVSQREVRGDRNELLSVARAALRENPDVLVIEDFGSPEIVTLALEAAQSGHLVIGAITAHTATDAIDRIIDQTPPERRAKVQLGLAENLRGVVAQALLRKSGGGRVAAREVLLNTSAVANLIAEGKTSQLPMAIDSGRKHGMVALNDALVASCRAASSIRARRTGRRPISRDFWRCSSARASIRRLWNGCVNWALLAFDERPDLFQQRLQDILFAQLVHRRSTFHRPLVLDDAPAAGAVHASAANGSSCDVSSANSMKSSADFASAMRRPPFGVKTVKLYPSARSALASFCTSGAAVIRALGVRGRRVVERRAARRGALAAVCRWPARRRFAELGDFDSGSLARHEC